MTQLHNNTDESCKRKLLFPDGDWPCGFDVCTNSGSHWHSVKVKKSSVMYFDSDSQRFEVLEYVSLVDFK